MRWSSVEVVEEGEGRGAEVRNPCMRGMVLMEGGRGR